MGSIGGGACSCCIFRNTHFVVSPSAQKPESMCRQQENKKLTSPPLIPFRRTSAVSFLSSASSTISSTLRRPKMGMIAGETPSRADSSSQSDKVKMASKFSHTGMYDLLGDLQEDSPQSNKPAPKPKSSAPMQEAQGPFPPMMPSFDSYFWVVYGNKLRTRHQPSERSRASKFPHTGMYDLLGDLQEDSPQSNKPAPKPKPSAPMQEAQDLIPPMMPSFDSYYWVMYGNKIRTRRRQPPERSRAPPPQKQWKYWLLDFMTIFNLRRAISPQQEIRNFTLRHHDSLKIEEKDL